MELTKEATEIGILSVEVDVASFRILIVLSSYWLAIVPVQHD